MNELAITNPVILKEALMYVNKLIKNIDKIKYHKPVLFCFPYAGGGASVYNKWIQSLEDVVTVCSVQLPGREDRISEKPYIDMNKALDDLEEIIATHKNLSYYLWGHSMGGRMAYEFEKRLERKGFLAKGMFVSGSRAPHILEKDPIYHLPDDAFKEKLARFDGTPREILENQMLFDFFLPLLRADFTMDETYEMKEKVILNTPIYAFCGDLDREANQEEMSAWEKYTSIEFQLKMFSGGHFFIKEQEEAVVRCIKQTIEER